MILFVLAFVTSEVVRGVAAYDVSYEDDGEGLSTWESRNREQQAKLVKDEAARSKDVPDYSYIPKHHPLTQPAGDE